MRVPRFRSGLDTEMMLALALSASWMTHQGHRRTGLDASDSRCAISDVGAKLHQRHSDRTSNLTLHQRVVAVARSVRHEW